MASSNERMQKMLAKDRVFNLMQIMYDPDRFADVIHVLDSYVQDNTYPLIGNLDLLGLPLSNNEVAELLYTYEDQTPDSASPFNYLQQLMNHSLLDYINTKELTEQSKPSQDSGLLKQMKALQDWIDSLGIIDAPGFQQAYTELETNNKDLFDFITKQINIADIKNAHVIANFFINETGGIPDYIKDVIQDRMDDQKMEWDGVSAPGIVDLRKDYTPAGKPGEKAINLIRCTDIGVSQNTAYDIINQEADFINTGKNLMCDGNKNPFREINFIKDGVTYTVAAKLSGNRILFCKVPIDKLGDESAYKLIDATDTEIASTYPGGLTVLDAITDSFKRLSNYANGLTLTADDLNRSALQAGTRGEAGEAPAPADPDDVLESIRDLFTEDETSAPADAGDKVNLDTAAAVPPSAASTSTAGKSDTGGKAETTPGGASATPTPTGDASDLQKLKSQLDAFQDQLDRLVSTGGGGASTADATRDMLDAIRQMIENLPRGGGTHIDNSIDNSIRDSFNTYGVAAAQGGVITPEQLQLIIENLRGAVTRAEAAETAEAQVQTDGPSPEDLQAEIAALREQLKERDLRIGALEETVIYQAEMIADLERANGDLRENIQAFRDANQQLANLVHALRGRVSALEDQNSTLTDELEASRETVSRLERELQVAGRRNAELEAELDDANIDLEDAREQNENLAADVVTFATRANDLEAEVEGIGEQLQQANLEIAQLQEQIAAQPVPVETAEKGVGPDDAPKTADMGTDPMPPELFEDKTEHLNKVEMKNVEAAEATRQPILVEESQQARKVEVRGATVKAQTATRSVVGGAPELRKVERRERKQYTKHEGTGGEHVGFHAIMDNTMGYYDPNQVNIYLVLENKSGERKIYEQSEDGNKTIFQEVRGLKKIGSGHRLDKKRAEKVTIEDLQQQQEQQNFNVRGYIYTDHLSDMLDNGKGNMSEMLKTPAINTAIENGWMRDKVEQMDKDSPGSGAAVRLTDAKAHARNMSIAFEEWKKQPSKVHDVQESMKEKLENANQGGPSSPRPKH